MKKSGSDTTREIPEQELKRLRKENARLKTQKVADKAKIKGLKRAQKNMPTITISEEQRKLLSNLFPDIDSLFS